MPRAFIWKRSIRRSLDLLVLVGLVFLAVASIESPWTPLVRVPLAILLVMVFPGIALVSGLFVTNDGPTRVARMTLTVVLSLAIVPPVALFLDWTTWGVTRSSMAWALAAATIVATGFALYRRGTISDAERFEFRRDLPAISGIRTQILQNRLIAISLGVVAILLLAGGYQSVKVHLTGGNSTEFAMLNSEGAAEFYPQNLRAGEVGEVTLLITNHEGTPVQYRVVIPSPGTMVGNPIDVALGDDDTWSGLVGFSVDLIGDDQAISFELYRADQAESDEPYRTLILHVNVSAASDSP